MKQKLALTASVTALLAGLANVAYGIDISASIPGQYATTATSSPSAFVANFYQYALSVAGILAFGIIVYGGVKYMASVGNPSGQSDAKEWIKAAIMGILLLAGAYMILNVINPNLVSLNLPTLDGVKPTSQSSTK